MIKNLLILASVLVTVFSTLGLYIQDPVSTNSFKCFTTHNVSFVVTKTWTENGLFDNNGLASIQNALAVGYRPDQIGIYMDYCVSQTTPPETQFQQMINTLRNFGQSYSSIWIGVGTQKPANCKWGTNYTQNC